jgi:predicted nucleic acid-binding protein
MRTALDANILSALWSNEPVAPRIAYLLQEAYSHGAVVICAPVYAELLAHPSAPPGFIDTFVAETAISIDWDLGEEVWRRAGNSFASYARRRRISQGGSPRRMLVDFLVAAHSLLRADQFMTLDTNWYMADFPNLKMVSPHR